MDRDPRLPVSCSEPLPEIQSESARPIWKELQYFLSNPHLPSDPITCRDIELCIRCLLCKLYQHLRTASQDADHIARDLVGALTDNDTSTLPVWNCISVFITQLFDIVLHIRVISRFYSRLSRCARNYCSIKHLWCRLDLLHHQLGAYHSILSEHSECKQIPIQSLEAIASSLTEVGAQALQWSAQLVDDFEYVRVCGGTKDGFCEIQWADSEDEG
jgi:hypothetical protein